MILYHGSNVEINTIDLDKCRPFKDFGKGFYVTTLKDQARNMAHRTVKVFGGREIITVFELQDSKLENFNVKSSNLLLANGRILL